MHEARDAAVGPQGDEGEEEQQQPDPEAVVEELLSGPEARYEEALRGKPCVACGGLQDEDHMILCDQCKQSFHPVCGADGGRNPVHAGLWYCVACRGAIHLHGFADITQDLGLMDYLWLGTLPDQPEEAARVRRVAMRYRASGHELQTKISVYGSSSLEKWVNVPPVPMRRDITRDYHEVLAHAGGRRLAESIMSHWWWPGLWLTAATVVRECQVCQRDRVTQEGPTTIP